MAVGVTSVTPANGAGQILANTPVVVVLAGEAGSNDYSKVETSTADFEAETLTDVYAGSNALVLLKKILDDYEGDTIGQIPAGYTARHATYGTVQAIDAQQAVKFPTQGSATGRLITRDTPSVADWDVVADVRGASASSLIIDLRWKSAGSQDRYRFIARPGTNSVIIAKVVGGSYSSLVSASKTIAVNTWYQLRAQAIGTALRLKIWSRGSSEPSVWDLSTTNAEITGAGLMGIDSDQTPEGWFDNVTIRNQGTSYAASGNRVSPAHSLTSVGNLGSHTIEWDVTLPSNNTTLTVEASYNGGAYQACTSGASIPGMPAAGTDMTGTTLAIRANLATTASSETPTLLEIRLLFTPADPARVEVTIDGVSATTANGSLDVIDDSEITGGAIVDDHSALKLTARPWWYDSNVGSVTVLVKYDGSTISTTTLTAFNHEPGGPGPETYWTGLATEAEWRLGDGLVAWICADFAPSLWRGEVSWLCVDMPRLGVDAYYWVAHPIWTDGAGAVVVGQPATTDGCGAVIVEGWALADGVAGVIVQSYTWAIGAGGAVIVAHPVESDGAGAVASGTPTSTDGAGTAIAYQVNRRNVIELDILSPETATTYTSLGITWS